MKYLQTHNTPKQVDKGTNQQDMKETNKDELNPAVREESHTENKTKTETPVNNQAEKAKSKTEPTQNLKTKKKGHSSRLYK